MIEALRPFVVGGIASPPDQEQTAAHLQMPISTFRNSLRRLSLRSLESLRAEVIRTVSSVSEADEEMRYLFRVLVS